MINNTSLFTFLVAAFIYLLGPFSQAFAENEASSNSKGRLNLKAEMGRHNYVLNSAPGGLNVNLTGMAHYAYGISYLKTSDNRRNLYSFTQSNQSRTSPYIPNSSTVIYSPAVFNIRKQYVSWEMQDFVWSDSSGKLKNLYLGAGVFVQNRWADVSLPQQLVASSVKAGFIFTVGYEKEINQNFGYELRGGIQLPTYNVEYGFQTGSYIYTISPNASATAIYHVSQLIDFSLGISVAQEKNYYNGTGNRGGLNSNETFTEYAVPVELRFKL